MTLKLAKGKIRKPKSRGKDRSRQGERNAKVKLREADLREADLSSQMKKRAGEGKNRKPFSFTYSLFRTILKSEKALFKVLVFVVKNRDY